MGKSPCPWRQLPAGRRGRVEIAFLGSEWVIGEEFFSVKPLKDQSLPGSQRNKGKIRQVNKKRISWQMSEFHSRMFNRKLCKWTPFPTIQCPGGRGTSAQQAPRTQMDELPASQLSSQGTRAPTQQRSSDPEEEFLQRLQRTLVRSAFPGPGSFPRCSEVKTRVRLKFSIPWGARQKVKTG